MSPFKLNPPPGNLPPGSKIYVYLRDSGHEVQEFSVLQQRRALDDWAIQHGLIITAYYIDEARKGSTWTGRDELQKMMHALRHSASEAAVMVWSYNRFSRGLDEPSLYRAEIRTLGYLFHSLTDDVPEGPIGRIVEAVIDYKNYQYLIDLSLDIQRGQRDLVRIHGCVPGTPPRGFKRTPVTLGHHRDGSPHIAHRWDPDPETAPLVLMAFQMRAAGASLYAINDATHLYSSINSYATFWPNKLYIGILQFSDLEINDYCKPIVPRELWNAVQTRQKSYHDRIHIRSEKAHPRRLSSRYLLSGLLRCAQCDGVVNGNTSTYRGKKATDTYVCANVRKHLCKARRIPRELLEKGVFDEIKNYILDPEIALKRQKHDALNQQNRQLQIDAQRTALKKKLTITRRDLQRISAAIKARKHSKTLLEELDRLEAEETNLLSQISQLEQPTVPALMDPRVLGIQAAAIQKLLEIGTIEEKHAVLHGFIHRINVENIDKKIKVKIYFWSPFRSSQSDHDPPAVYFPQLPPGALEYIHSIEFEVIYKVGTPRKKSPLK